MLNGATPPAGEEEGGEKAEGVVLSFVSTPHPLSLALRVHCGSEGT